MRSIQPFHENLSLSLSLSLSLYLSLGNLLMLSYKINFSSKLTNSLVLQDTILSLIQFLLFISDLSQTQLLTRPYNFSCRLIDEILNDNINNAVLHKNAIQ